MAALTLGVGALLLLATIPVPAPDRDAVDEPEPSEPARKDGGESAWAFTYLGAPLSQAPSWVARGDTLVFRAAVAIERAGGEFIRGDFALARGHNASFTLDIQLGAGARVEHVLARDARGVEDVLAFEAGEAALLVAGREAAAARVPAGPVEVEVHRTASGALRVRVGEATLAAQGAVEAAAALGFRAFALPGDGGEAEVRAFVVEPAAVERFPAREFLRAPGAPVVAPPAGFDWIGTPSLVRVGDVTRLYARAHGEAENTGTVVLRYDSRDLATWRFAGVAFTRDALGVRSIEDPAMIVDGGKLVCVISGASNGGWDVHALESPLDREEWTHIGVALARGPRDGPDGWEVKKPSILNVSGTWHVWYDLRSRDGEARGLGLARGPTLTSLEKGPVATHVWGSPEVRAVAGGFEMMYDKGLPPSRSDGLFLAHSPDGITWTEALRVLAPGAPGTHDELSIFPTFVDAPGKRLVLYEGKHRDDDPSEVSEVDRHFGVVGAAARFDGFFEGITTDVDAEGTPLAYRDWPLAMVAIPGLRLRSDGPAVIQVVTEDGAIAVRVLEGRVIEATLVGESVALVH